MSHYIVLTGGAIIAGVTGILGIGTHDMSLSSSGSTVADVRVNRDSAIAIAQTHLSGTVRMAALDEKDGKKIWKIRIYSPDETQRADFTIDAQTGGVVTARIKETKNRNDNNAGEKENSGNETSLQGDVKIENENQGIWSNLDARVDYAADDKHQGGRG